MFGIAKDRRTEETIETALVTELSSLPNTELDKTNYWEEDGKIASFEAAERMLMASGL